MSALKKLQTTDTATVFEWPTQKLERFKYTNIAAAVKNLAVSPAAATLAVQSPYAQIVTADKAPQWVRDKFLAPSAGEAQYKDMILWHAANAAQSDILVIDVPKNADAGQIDLAQTGIAGQHTSPRVVIRVASGASLTLVQNQSGDGAYWNNAMMICDVAANARLRHYRIQDDAATSVYTQNTDVTIERDGTYEAFVLTIGASLSRNQIHAVLAGENAEVRLSGINLLSGTQHADTTITIDHAAPNCRSNQTYKSIIDDKAHGVFQGKVHVHQIAQKTDGYQLSNTLLLSPTAEMDTKPELEIYADDVKCSHGATTGQLDTAPLFYLRSRGLSEAEAKMLLMQAFLGPAFEEIRDEAVQETISALALGWLEKRKK